MQAIAKTDIGLLRQENQDRVKYKVIDKHAVMVVVCDGMGGEAAGGEASEIAVNAIFDRLMLNYRSDATDNGIRNYMISAVNAANTIVYEHSLTDSSKIGMGTTCVCALIKNNIAYITSVGDSRAYILNPAGIEQITQDHTIVRILFEQGKIKKEEIQTHPQKNIITRAVGIDKTIEVDYYEIPIEETSKIVLCTDGLSNCCTDEEIYNIVIENNINIACDLLIDLAKQHGGRDNITIAIIDNSNMEV